MHTTAPRGNDLLQLGHGSVSTGSPGTVYGLSSSSLLPTINGCGAEGAGATGFGGGPGAIASAGTFVPCDMSDVPHVGQIGAWLGPSRTRSPHSGQVKTAFFVRGGAVVIAVDAAEVDSTLGAAMVGAEA